FGDPTGGAPLCMTKTKHRVLLTYEVTQEMENKAPQGLLLTPDILPDRKVKVVMALLGTQHTLDGKTVAILGSSDAKAEINNAIEPGLKKLNIKRGSTGIVTVTSTDTSAAQAQLDGFIEKWRTEGVNALVLAGTSIEQRPFVDKVRKAFPDITLV